MRDSIHDQVTASHELLRHVAERAHAQTAEEHGVKYDGWGALVVT